MKCPTLYTSLSPELVYLHEIPNLVAVVIDVLRATSTMAAALDRGAKKIIPVTSVEECRRLGNELDCITAGERNGVTLPGLNKGNSPLEFEGDDVRNKTIALTTTNGTVLLNELLLHDVDTIITGAFVNISEVCDYLLSQEQDVLLACAGWRGHVNVEDSLFAGAVAERLQRAFHLADSSIVVQHLYQLAKQQYTSLADFLSTKETSHYQRFKNFKKMKDIKRCFTEDYYPTLPIYRDDGLVAWKS